MQMPDATALRPFHALSRDAAEGQTTMLVGIVVVAMEKAAMDDVLTILTHTEKAGGAKMVLNQQIRSGETLLISAKVIIAVINARGRPRRLPETLAAKFLEGSTPL